MEFTPSKPTSQISDESINAFIDRQITNEERLEILSMIKQDNNLAARICELKQLKEMTQHAFENIPNPPSQQQISRPVLPRIAAAMVIFTVGLLIGFAGLQFNQQRLSTQFTSINNSTTKVLVHLTSSNVDSGLNTLNNLQQLLNSYIRNKQSVLIEVVANGDGIKLLDASSTAMALRITELLKSYDNLTFAACKNTIDQMKLTKGINIQLIPAVKLIDSGVVQVIQRQSQGWTYIRG